MLKTHTETVTEERQIVDALVCDICGREAELDDYVEYQEFVRIHFIGGYGSIFGDCVEHRCDMCQHCVKAVLGKHLKVVGGGWWGM